MYACCHSSVQIGLWSLHTEMHGVSGVSVVSDVSMQRVAVGPGPSTVHLSASYPKDRLGVLQCLHRKRTVPHRYAAVPMSVSLLHWEEAVIGRTRGAESRRSGVQSTKSPSQSADQEEAAPTTMQGCQLRPRLRSYLHQTISPDATSTDQLLGSASARVHGRLPLLQQSIDHESE